MTNCISHYRAAATAAAALAACVLACALLGAFASAAAAFSPSSTTGSESTPLDLKAPSTTSSATSGGGGASIVRTIVGLAIVIAVIWGLAWILRQVKSGRDPQTSSTGLTSIAALSLSTGRSVHLVKAGSDYLLLGSAEQGVVPIHRYTEEEARQAGLLDVIDAPAKPRRALLRPPSEPTYAPGAARVATGTVVHRPGGGHDPMRMPQDRPGSGVVDRLREMTVRH
jgi:flagellar protein FliO/FliZ